MLQNVKCQNKMAASTREPHYAMTSEELEDTRESGSLVKNDLYFNWPVQISIFLENFW